MLIKSRQRLKLAVLINDVQNPKREQLSLDIIEHADPESRVGVRLFHCRQLRQPHRKVVKFRWK